MPTDDELIRRLTMGGLDPHMAALVADKHGEQRVVKLRVKPTTPHILDGTLSLFTLQPGEQLLGYAAAVSEVFHTTRFGALTATNAPALPVTSVDAPFGDTIPIAGMSMALAPATYNTIGALVIALNAGTDHATIGTWSAVGGKLMLTFAVEFLAGFGTNSQLTNDLGFTGSELATGVVPYISVFDAGAESLTELLSPGLTGADQAASTPGLLAPATIDGIVGATATLGYLPPSADPVVYHVALRNELGNALLTAGDLTGSGDAFVWVWLSSMF